MLMGRLFALALGWRPPFLFTEAKKSPINEPKAISTEILDKHDARGEISKEDYYERATIFRGKLDTMRAAMFVLF